MGTGIQWGRASKGFLTARKDPVLRGVAWFSASLFFVFCFFVFCPFRATTAAYGSSQAGGPIGATTASHNHSHSHSHSHVGSKLSL